jgi:AAHS family 4-hydroxybenzoate transporter-like MFS transporter
MVTAQGAHGIAVSQSKLGPLELTVTVLCGLVAMLDGFDTQAIAYVAPRIAENWGLAPSAFGPIFSIGLFGLTLGAFILSPLADRYGRKAIILLSTAIFGAFALLTAATTSIDQLLILRLLTGVGLGAAMPNIIALTSEYAPARLRATLVTVMFCGFPLGSTLGGVVAGPLIKAFDWHGVFVVGGLLPILLLPLLVFVLPESARFLVARNSPESRIAPIVRRLGLNVSTAEFILQMRVEQSVADLKGRTRGQLFEGRRLPATLLLWVAFFMNLLVMYFLVNWLPTLLKQAGLPLGTAILSTAVLNLGGVVGGLALGRLIDRFGPYRVLTLSFVFSASFVAVIAYGGTVTTLLLVGAGLAGFGVVGAQIGCNALAASLYPTAIRATGVGWALGAGRIGAIVGPLVGGYLLSLHWSPRDIILTAVGPALLAASAIFALGCVKPEIEG